MKEHKVENPADVRALGVIDLQTMQRYLNFHFSVTIDLFGSDASSNAASYYTTGGGGGGGAAPSPGGHGRGAFPAARRRLVVGRRRRLRHGPPWPRRRFADDGGRQAHGGAATAASMPRRRAQAQAQPYCFPAVSAAIDRELLVVNPLREAYLQKPSIKTCQLDDRAHQCKF